MTDYLTAIRNPDDRIRALHEIDQWSDDHVRDLIAALSDPFPGVRFTAAAMLADGVEGEEQLVEIVDGSATGEVSMDARRAAVLALRRELTEPTLGVVVSATEHPDPIVRYHAMLAVDENTEHVDLESIVTRAITDDDDDVAIVAAQWASQFKWLDFVPAIDQARQKRKSGEVRLQFAIALAALAPDQLPGGVVHDLVEGLSDDRTARPAALAIAAANVRAAVPGLITVTRKLWYHVIIRIDAAAVLASLGEPLGLEKLRKFVTDRREHVSAYACECVGRYHLDALVPELTLTLGATDDRALAAVVALKQLGTKEAIAALDSQAAVHPNDAVRRAITE